MVLAFALRVANTNNGSRSLKERRRGWFSYYRDVLTTTQVMPLSATYASLVSVIVCKQGTQLMLVDSIMFMFASTVAWLFGGGIVYALIIFASLDMALFLASKLLKNTLEPPEDIWAPLLVVELATCAAYTSGFLVTGIVTTLRQAWHRQKENEQLKLEIESLRKQTPNVIVANEDDKAETHVGPLLHSELDKSTNHSQQDSTLQESGPRVEMILKEKEEFLCQLNLKEDQHREEVIQLQTIISNLENCSVIAEEKLKEQDDHIACIHALCEKDTSNMQAEIATLNEKRAFVEEQLRIQIDDALLQQKQFEEKISKFKENISGLRNYLNTAERKLKEQTDDGNVMHEQHEEQISQLQDNISDLQKDLANAEERIQEEENDAMLNHDTHTEQITDLQKAIDCFEEKIKEQEDQIALSHALYKRDISNLQREIKDLNETKDSAEEKLKQENGELRIKYRNEILRRRECHNKLVELKGNIRVFARIRPPIEEDGDDPDVVVDLDPDDGGSVNVRGQAEGFEVDRAFAADASQSDIFNEVQALVTSCIDGYNVCIFAYGQTGSGKTYTMEGTKDKPGINQRALNQLFEETARQRGEWKYSISVSIVEIYLNRLRDLLCHDINQKLEVKMAQDGGHHLPGLTSQTVNSMEDVAKVLETGIKNRQTASTKMNQQSSRSHVLLTVTVEGINMKTDQRNIGKLNLVDLAGSERATKTGAEGERLREAQSINKSLFHLKEVIRALGNPEKERANYRNSLLTKLLEDSLGGDSKTLMVVQVSPVQKNVGDTTESLRFAAACRAVEIPPEHQDTPKRKKSSAPKTNKKVTAKTSHHTPKSTRRERSVSVGPANRPSPGPDRFRVKRLRSTSAGHSPEGSPERSRKPNGEQLDVLPNSYRGTEPEEYTKVFKPTHDLERDFPHRPLTSSIKKKTENDIPPQTITLKCIDTGHQLEKQMVIPRDPHVDLLDTDQSTPCRTSDATRNARHADLPQKEYKETAASYPETTSVNLTEDEQMEVMMQGHDNLVSTLRFRSKMLENIHGQSGSGNFQRGIETALNAKDDDLMVEILGIIVHKGKLWNLNMCYTVLPTIKKLLSSTRERTVGIACTTLKLILTVFATVIRENMTLPYSIGVDISREERHQKCEICHRILMEIRPLLDSKRQMNVQLCHEFELLKLFYLHLE